VPQLHIHSYTLDSDTHAHTYTHTHTHTPKLSPTDSGQTVKSYQYLAIIFLVNVLISEHMARAYDSQLSFATLQQHNTQLHIFGQTLTDNNWQ